MKIKKRKNEKTTKKTGNSLERAKQNTGNVLGGETTH